MRYGESDIVLEVSVLSEEGLSEAVSAADGVSVEGGGVDGASSAYALDRSGKSISRWGIEARMKVKIRNHMNE